MMKKCFAMMMPLLLTGTAMTDGKKLSVVTTIYPIYD